MRAALRSLLPLACFLVAACSGGPVGVTFPLRNGPEFQVAFPDPTVLVTTRDVNETRRLLATVPLPETDEHHELLTQLLADAKALNTENLLLLTEAVSQSDEAVNRIVVVRSGDQGVTFWGRGSGPYAGVIDELLLDGLRKVRDPSPRNLGRLLSRTQTEECVIALATRSSRLEYSSEWDDGSADDLEEILEAANADQVRLELCVGALLPEGRLNEARAEVAVRSMNFDDNRTRFLEADYARRTSLSPEALLGHVRLMSFDDGRVEVVRMASPILQEIDGKQVLRLVQTASFDDGRIEIVEALAERMRIREASEALAIIQTASFDSGRGDILEALVRGPFMELGGEALVAFVQTASFDSGREKLLTTLRPHARSPLSASEVRQLMQTASFDDGRRNILELFADDLRDLPAGERDEILGVFSFDSSRRKARESLGW